MTIHLIRTKLHLSAKKKRNTGLPVKSITFISFILHSSSAWKLQAQVKLEVRVKPKVKAGLHSYNLSTLLFIIQGYTEQICNLNLERIKTHKRKTLIQVNFIHTRWVPDLSHLNERNFFPIIIAYQCWLPGIRNAMQNTLKLSNTDKCFL